MRLLWFRNMLHLAYQFLYNIGTVSSNFEITHLKFARGPKVRNKRLLIMQVMGKMLL